MKSLITTVLLLGFVSVAVFGFAGVSHGAADAHDSGCIMAIAQGTDCPTKESAADYLSFHLNAFKSFSTATLGETLLASLYTLLLLVLSIGAMALLRGATPPLSFACARHRRKRSPDSSAERELLRWLSHHEHSPTSH